MRKRGRERKNKISNKKKEKKKGLSTIIVTIILIALVLIAVGIMWAVISNLITKQKQEINLEKLTVDAEIKGTNINEQANNISVLVRRKPGAGNLIGFNFVFNNGTDNELYTVYTTQTMKELEEIIFTFSPLMNVSEILTISLIPLIKSGDKELYGNIVHEYNVKTGKSIKPPGKCVPTTCYILGYNCGNWSNGTCAGTLNCGDCNASSTCVSGVCQPLAVCGNGICEEGETLTCPEDCGIISFIGADATIPTPYDYLQPLIDNQIRFIGQEMVYWNSIEPTELSGYQWNSFDSIIQKIEAVDGIIIPTLWSASTWATEYSSSGKPSSPPKSGYEQRYYDFIKNFVERYDKDGIDDMLGLKYAHNFIVIEDEAQNIGDSWVVPVSCGSIQQTQAYYECGAVAYGEMLKLAYNASNEANPNIKVGSFAFNPGDYFDANDKNTAPPSVKVYFLDKVFIDYWNYFDIIAVQCNYDYTGIPTWIKYIDDTYNQPKPVSERKPIICADAATMPMLTRHQFQGERFTNRYPYMTDNEILQILYDGISNANYSEIRPWWEAEKARLSTKKTIVAADLEADNIFFQFIMSPGNSPTNPWDHSGLLGKGLSKENDGAIGTPRIVVHALGQLSNSINDFKSIQNLNPIPLGQDPYNWSWMFSFDNGNVYVLWNEAGGTVDLNSYISTVDINVTFLVTEFESGGYGGYDPKFEGYIYPTNAIPISNTPIFVK